MHKVNFSQLWIEEEQFLEDQSKGLTKNSTIVEIGTAQGGSAYIFATSTEPHNATIHSFDISPSAEAYENLSGFSNVYIHSKSSVEGAKNWDIQEQGKIDLLFIDGSHTLNNVCEDFISWFPHVKDDGLIVLHDYDPVHRGGIAHLGVRILGDAILSLGVISEVAHVGRILGGRKRSLIDEENLKEECCKAWERIGVKVNKLLRFPFDQCDFIGVENEIVDVLRHLRGSRGYCTEQLPTSKTGESVFLPQPLSKEYIDYLVNSDSVLLDELSFYYLFWESLYSNRNRVLKITQNRNAFFKWEEVLEMLDHSAGIRNLEDVFQNKINSDLSVLSRICARELVRMSILKNILSAILTGNA